MKCVLVSLFLLYAKAACVAHGQLSVGNFIKLQRKEACKKGGTPVKLYDEDGCYCLLIAILTGLDASKARKLYQYGPNHPICRKFMKRRQTSVKKHLDTRTERMRVMKEMREEGCGIEMLAAIFDCDCSTVKRTLKKAEVKTDDGI